MYKNLLRSLDKVIAFRQILSSMPRIIISNDEIKHDAEATPVRILHCPQAYHYPSASDLFIRRCRSSSHKHLCHFHVSGKRSAAYSHRPSGRKAVPRYKSSQSGEMIISTFTKISWTGLRASLALSPLQHPSGLQPLYPGKIKLKTLFLRDRILRLSTKFIK
jgi:hypothetical protein